MRHQLRAKARSMDFVVAKMMNLRYIHATGFSQWSLTKQNERRIHSARSIVVLPRNLARQ
ncbi:MAG: hypothetical protein N3B10_13075 [Armatimonadetes bacterium]|nr:hypothetical protein [Armatimonadota bacterium]